MGRWLAGCEVWASVLYLRPCVQGPSVARTEGLVGLKLCGQYGTPLGVCHVLIYAAGLYVGEHLELNQGC